MNIRLGEIRFKCIQIQWLPSAKFRGLIFTQRVWGLESPKNCRTIRCYTGIGSNIHRQEFIFSCYDKVKCIALDVSSYLNMVFQPKAFEKAEELFGIHINLGIDIVIKVTE